MSLGFEPQAVSGLLQDLDVHDELNHEFNHQLNQTDRPVYRSV